LIFDLVFITRGAGSLPIKCYKIGAFGRVLFITSLVGQTKERTQREKRDRGKRRGDGAKG